MEDIWIVAQRGTDNHGEWAWIDRIRDTRTTSWKLYRMPDGWRYFKIIFSRENSGLNGRPEREKTYREGDACPCHTRGVKLTDSRLDRTLLYLCEHGL